MHIYKFETIENHTQDRYGTWDLEIGVGVGLRPDQEDSEPPDFLFFSRCDGGGHDGDWHEYVPDRYEWEAGANKIRRVVTDFIRKNPVALLEAAWAVF